MTGFLANENIPRAAVALLREKGLDVAWVLEVAPGAPDARVLERSTRERRVLLTFDKDFGELAYRGGRTQTHGVVLLRLTTDSPEEVAQRVCDALLARDDWAGHFSVIADDRLRMTPLQ